METAREEELDSLASLEERILKTVELVSELREERDIVMRDLEAAIASKEQTSRQLAELQDEHRQLQDELEGLRTEHRNVKSRIQKVLGQLDVLGGS
jgi:uncharacterized coiled-coil DUF342 family protein